MRSMNVRMCRCCITANNTTRNPHCTSLALSLQWRCRRRCLEDNVQFARPNASDSVFNVAAILMNIQLTERVRTLSSITWVSGKVIIILRSQAEFEPKQVKQSEQ